MESRHSDTTPPPSWDRSDIHGLGHIGDTILREGGALFRWFILHRGNKVQYLRSLGVIIGDDCDILTSVRNIGTEPWLIRLGNRVTITQDVLFVTHDGSNRVFRHRLPDAAPWGNRFGPIDIKDNSFIGARSILLPGVAIGPDSIVGVNSVVASDIPPNTVAAGTPARPIATLDEFIARYQEKAIPILARDREALRRELTTRFWGEPH